MFGKNTEYLNWRLIFSTRTGTVIHVVIITASLRLKTSSTHVRRCLMNRTVCSYSSFAWTRIDHPRASARNIEPFALCAALRHEPGHPVSVTANNIQLRLQSFGITTILEPASRSGVELSIQPAYYRRLAAGEKPEQRKMGSKRRKSNGFHGFITVNTTRRLSSVCPLKAYDWHSNYGTSESKFPSFPALWWSKSVDKEATCVRLGHENH
jgi:hypothetical protein